MVLEVRRDIGIRATEDLCWFSPFGVSWQRVATLDIGRFTASRPTPDLDGVVRPFHCHYTATTVVETVTISVGAPVVNTAASGVRGRLAAVIVAICGEEFSTHGVRIASDFAVASSMQSRQRSLSVADAFDDVDLTTIGPAATFRQGPIYRLLALSSQNIYIIHTSWPCTAGASRHVREVSNPETSGPGILTFDANTGSSNIVFVVVVGVVSLCEDRSIVNFHPERSIGIDRCKTLLSGNILRNVGNETMSRISI